MGGASSLCVCVCVCVSVCVCGGVCSVEFGVPIHSVLRMCVNNKCQK